MVWPWRLGTTTDRRMRRQKHSLSLTGLSVLACLGVMCGIGRIVRQQDLFPTLTVTLSDELALVVQSDAKIMTFHPGELPGYTGWARPHHTLAGYFTILSANATSMAEENWTLTVQCQGHVLCSTTSSPPLFYVRAYGPSILTGLVESLPSPGTYQCTFRPFVPGTYTVEMVLTYSNPIPMDQFPLPQSEIDLDYANRFPSIFYEGYLLNGFPFSLQVSSRRKTVNSNPSSPLCGREALLIRSSIDGFYQGQWKVVNHVRFSPLQPVHLTNSTIALSGYQRGQNSLGFQAEYSLERSKHHCRLISPPSDPIPPSFASDTHHRPYACLFQDSILLKSEQSRFTLHIILIGDSTMRLQRDVLERWLATLLSASRTAGGAPEDDTFLLPARVRVSFHELYGGTLRCTRQTGPNLTLLSQGPWEPEERRVVVFNSGLHDIHRLCGAEFESDRATYLTEEELDLPCIQLYPKVVRILADAVSGIPADLRIFQTTTAGWLKYGNYGVAWDPRYGQTLPLDSAFVEAFNQVALNLLQREYWDRIVSVDGYWISLARPDHREVDHRSALGKKLSHPGVEVIEAMVRIWSMVIMHTFCELRSS